MTELSRVEFVVLGEPQPQGSKTTVLRKGKRPVMREDNPGTKPWRQRVEACALEAMAGRPPRDGPLELRVVFVFTRPASHWGTGRNAGQLKPSAPVYSATRPDLDKLLRGVADSLTGIVYRDDARVVIVQGEKHYGEPARAHVTVLELDLDDDRAVHNPDDTRPKGETVNETTETTTETTETTDDVALEDAPDAPADPEAEAEPEADEDPEADEAEPEPGE